MSKKQLQYLEETWGSHGHVRAWNHHDKQPSGFVSIPPPPRCGRVKVERRTSSPSSEAAARTEVALPGNTTEAHYVVLKLCALDESTVSEHSPSERSISAGVTLPCDLNTICCTAANALMSKSPTMPVLYDECGHRLPTEVGPSNSQCVIQFHPSLNKDTFAGLAAAALKAKRGSLEIGLLQLETLHNGIASVDLDFELPLHIQPTDFKSRRPASWDLVVELSYSLPRQLTDGAQLLTDDASAEFASVDAHHPTTSDKNNPAPILVTSRDYKAISRLAMEQLSVPGHASALSPNDRFLVHFFFHASRKARHLVINESPFKDLFLHDSRCGFPLLAGPDLARTAKDIVPINLMSFGRFYGNSLLNDDCISWTLKYTLAGGGALDPAGRKDVLIFNTQFYNMLCRGLELSRIARCTKRVDWKHVRHIIVPIHLPNHWTLVALRDMRCQKTTPGRASLSGSLSYYDSMRGRPSHIFRQVLDFLCYALSTQLMSGRTVSPDNVRQRAEQPGNDPRQGSTMNCGVFCAMTAKSLIEGWPLANVAESYMHYFREASALAMLRHPTESVDRNGFPTPLICMGACLGARVLDPPTHERNCAPSALLAVLANHVAFHDTEHTLPSTDDSASSLLQHIATSAIKVRDAPAARAVALLRSLTRSTERVRLARCLLARAAADATLKADGAPVPVRALDAAMRLLAIPALLMHCDSARPGIDGLYSLGADSSETSPPTSVLLYTSHAHHIVSLSWAEACGAQSFVRTATSFFSNTAAESNELPLLQQMTSRYVPQPVSNHAPSSTWLACGTMPDNHDFNVTPSYCKSITGDADADGLAQGFCDATLSWGGLQLIGEFKAGRPCGSITIQKQQCSQSSSAAEAFSIQLDTERPSALDYDSSPTRIAKGSLWPRLTLYEGGGLRRVITFRLAAGRVRSYEVSPSARDDEAVDLRCLDAEEGRVAGKRLASLMPEP